MESIAKVGDALRALDLTEQKAGQAVREFEGGKVTVLYESDAARQYR